jgi:hypothetical protein
MGTPAGRERNRGAPRLRPAHMVPSSYRERPSGVGGLRAGMEVRREVAGAAVGRVAGIVRLSHMS